MYACAIFKEPRFYKISQSWTLEFFWWITHKFFLFCLQRFSVFILFWIGLGDFLYPCFGVHWLIKWPAESGEVFPSSSYFDWHKRNSTDFLTNFATTLVNKYKTLFVGVAGLSCDQKSLRINFIPVHLF